MWDFGHADSVEPEAIGEPGNRRFRMRVVAGSETASLWMEKEQLAALGLALRRLLEQTTDTTDEGELAPITSGDPFPDPADVEIRLSRLGIGHDEQATVISIFAYDMETDGEDANAGPTFTYQVGRQQSRRIAERAEEIVSAGRPVCVLCGVPIDEDGHKCQRRNGHSERFVSQG